MPVGRWTGGEHEIVKTRQLLDHQNDRLTLAWHQDIQAVGDLVAFFVRNVTSTYISCGEIQCGRAIDTNTWSLSLRAVLLDEFTKASRNEGMAWEGRRILTGVLVGRLVGLAVLDFHLSALNPYVVLEDMVVEEDLRGLGLGRQMLDWIERHVVALGAGDLFLESGIANLRAHTFFESNGFAVVSKVLLKTLRGRAARTPDRTGK